MKIRESKNDYNSSKNEHEIEENEHETKEHQYLFTEFEDVEDDLEGFLEDQQPLADIDLDLATINDLVSRRNLMKILMYLYLNGGAYSVTEISRKIGMPYPTVKGWLDGAVKKTGIVKETNSLMDTRKRIFQAVKCTGLTKTINRYLWLCGYALGKQFLTEEGVTVNDLLANPEFIKRCTNHYGFPPLLGIEAIKSNKHKCIVKGELLIRRDVYVTVPLKEQPQQPSEDEVGERILSEVVKEEKETASTEADDVIDLLK